MPDAANTSRSTGHRLKGRAAGCHAVQGYLIARPMPAGELGGYLAGYGGRVGSAAWSGHPFADSAS